MNLRDDIATLRQLSRRELAEELAFYRKQALGSFRNDEGTCFDQSYFEFQEQLRALEQQAEETGLTPKEIYEAHARVEARERFYRRLFRHHPGKRG